MQAFTVCSVRPRTALPVARRRELPITTVQAPQSPSLQPSLVPVQRASSRSQSSTLRVGAASLTSTTLAAVEEADRAGVHGALRADADGRTVRP